ncbi:cyclic GMP-AMP synthase DncV-like nucleotidyltransferase [Bacillus sp. NPDC094106]|uniref:cyclic GMP-AMP synthase DncV-like nucleotidyltransferase n=1 Tax=Bacillus sp. NPDC094106 TaxID=3363949 RepID=UPI00380B8926
MYNLNSKFKNFYDNHVVLSRDEQTELRNKKDLNITRLKEGLAEYNADFEKDYKLVDSVVQGSVAMSTVTQNDENEYDIDVAIIFDKDNIPDSTKSVKNIIVNALKRKCTRFRTEPEAKTNCVRIEYASGYHIDFAIYRRFLNDDGEYEYEHCGSQWRSRDPWAITDWFNIENKTSDDNLRRVVRLLKMFCKSRDGWSMPGGLIQSVLASEVVSSNERLDITFYETICGIRDRLLNDKSVYNPTDTSLSLLFTKKDEQKINNLYNRLTSYINKLDVLFTDKCTEPDAINAWNEFFKHSFWGEKIQENASIEKSARFENSREQVDVEMRILFAPGVEINFTEYKGKIPKGRELKFIAYPNFNDYTQIQWTVMNEGDECGSDITHQRIGKTVTERTMYRGKHTMLCRVYRNDRLMCEKTLKVPIR